MAGATLVSHRGKTTSPALASRCGVGSPPPQTGQASVGRVALYPRAGETGPPPSGTPPTLFWCWSRVAVRNTRVRSSHAALALSVAISDRRRPLMERMRRVLFRQDCLCGWPRTGRPALRAAPSPVHGLLGASTKRGCSRTGPDGGSPDHRLAQSRPRGRPRPDARGRQRRRPRVTLASPPPQPRRSLCRRSPSRSRRRTSRARLRQR
jgi:hypothetical protein